MVSHGLGGTAHASPRRVSGDEEAESPRLVMGWHAGPDFSGAVIASPDSPQHLRSKSAQASQPAAELVTFQQLQQQTSLAAAPPRQPPESLGQEYRQPHFAGSGPISRAATPSVMPGASAQAGSEPLPGSFVPLSAVGGGEPAAAEAMGSVEVSGGSSGGMVRDPSLPQSTAGYESGDDMDFASMRHCVNCTASMPLSGGVCMDCGHCSMNDNEIFDPTPAPESPGLDDLPGALPRRLQGDALVVISYDERMELHEEGPDSTHPERPDRIRAVMARLRSAQLLGRCVPVASRPATREEIETCHNPRLLNLLDTLSDHARLATTPSLALNSDTYVNKHSAFCARLSAGSCVEVTKAVVRGDARAGVAVVRPPGHHAESNTSMGFCLYNNAGIAARAAQAAGAERVLILDWDIHHGNGTQEVFDSDPSVLYMSLHRYDNGSFYPGTGAANECGVGAGVGSTVNVPWPCAGMRNGDYMAAFQHVVLPIAHEFQPDLIIISAGFDAAEGDPIGGCLLMPEAYSHMTAQLQLVAPTVALLEGGYNLLSVSRGMEAVVRVLLGERPPPLPEGQEASEMGMSAVALAMRVQARYWRSVRLLLSCMERQLEAAERAAAARLAASGQGQQGSAMAGWPGAFGRSEEEEEPGADEYEYEDEESDGGFDDELVEEDNVPADTPHQADSGSAGWCSEEGAEGGSQEEEEEETSSELEDEPDSGAAPGPVMSVAWAWQQQQVEPDGAAASDGETELSAEDGAAAAGPSFARAESALCDLTPVVGGHCELPPPSAAPAISSGTASTGAPASAAAHAAGWQYQAPLSMAPPAAAPASAASAPRDQWRRLAVKTEVFKRTQSRPQRLSPELGEVLSVQPPPLPALPPPGAGKDGARLP